MANTDFDLVILGTGPAGYALALSLLQHNKKPERMAIIGLPPKQAETGQIIDPRALAMNFGSRQFLTQLGVWPTEHADMLTVHVSQAGYLGQTIITHKELNVPCLGSVVTYDNLLARMYNKINNSGIIQIKQMVEKPKPASTIRIKTESGSINSHMAVVSHGNKPQGIHKSYNQHAVLATIRASKARAGFAFERFTEYGPLALLPHPQNDNLYSLVWCLPPKLAKEQMNSEPLLFQQSLQQAFGKRLGKLELSGKRFTFPLDLYAGPNIHGQHLIAIGNAAQTMHPVAGQGLNLGLRDVAQFSHSIEPWLARPNDNLQHILVDYAKHRRVDRGLTMAITDTLPRLFASNNPLQKHVCGLGLLAMDLIAPIRRGFARHLLQGQRL